MRNRVRNRNGRFDTVIVKMETQIVKQHRHHERLDRKTNGCTYGYNTLYTLHCSQRAETVLFSVYFFPFLLLHLREACLVSASQRSLWGVIRVDHTTN